MAFVLLIHIYDGELSFDQTCDLDQEGDGYAYCQDEAYLEENLIAGDGNGDGICDVGEDCHYACPATLTIEDPYADDPDNDGDGVCELDETCVDMPTVANETAVRDVLPVCKDFSDDPTWIFNIEAFVNVLFGADNNGSYNVGFRFYPLPLP